ncbi:MAG: 23S rRNA (adenine(2503)-C(2))-methyltransferase RlmN [Polyangiaceae bacterium]|nr:23S rRNA (adenine(2503)-C(2))-methyltransferase RlmN [Polyangiaceae bacterium]
MKAVGTRTGAAATQAEDIARPPQPAEPVARLPEEWQDKLERLGEPPYRARQLFQWIHARGVYDPLGMSNLGRGLRELLVEEGVRPPATVVEVRRAGDGTRKIVYGLADGARVEGVLIPMTDDEEIDDSEDGAGAREADPLRLERRATLCVSTQYGCAVRCAFCASGRSGLLRGLRADEIEAQVLLARTQLDPGERLRNLVFMGMGEPLQNYDPTARALRLLMHPDGLGMSPRRITVSTVGVVPAMRRLGQDFAGKVGLALSLHAPDDATRARLVPINARYPIADLMRALRDYPLPKRRRITIEYTVIDAVNDSPAQARALAELLRPIPVKINLIAMNPVEGSPLGPPPRERVERFREILADAGYSCFLRTPRGDDVAAACGQLALRGRGEGTSGE